MKALVGMVAAAALALATAPIATAAPPNDSFAAATPLSGAQGGQEGSNAGATKESGEPAHAGNAGGRSVWYSWTAPEDGTYVFDTFGSSFDTLLALYTGGDVATLVEVTSNDDADVFFEPVTTSRVTFFATEGTTYAVAVDGFGGKSGRAVLRWRLGVPNDLFAHPQIVAGAVGSVEGTNVGATMEPGEPSPSSSAPSVWFEWTAPASGTVKFSTLGARFDTVVGVYTGTGVEALTTIAVNDDDPLFDCCASSFVGFDAVAGTVYRIAVGGWNGQQGRFNLSWSPLVLGTEGDDALVGTAGVEEIRGLGGNDVLKGLGGADVLVGGRGNDRSFGGSGNDVLIDRHGRDALVGGRGADILDSLDRSGGDTLDGGTGRDICAANNGDRRRNCA